MTNVITLASPRAGTRVHMSAQSPAFTTGKTDGIARQQAIENALSTALWHVRNGSGPISLAAATGRAIRAASMLKQASADMNSGVAA